MKFKETLLQGTLIKRYKRFFADISFKKKIITAHCPNSGSMMGLLNKGNKVYFSKSDNPNRKLKYTLEIIEVKRKLVGVNTHLTNKIVLEALKQRKLSQFLKYDKIETEKKFSDHTRFDFLLSNSKTKCFLEVKNVTLQRQTNVAEFPASITSRGTKHLNELIKARKMGFQSYILYLIQREDCGSFKIAKDIDEEYKITLNKALKNNVRVLCYDCRMSKKEIKINKQINYDYGL